MSQDAKVSIPKPFNEFTTGFPTIQELHSIRRKLHLVLSILDGNLETLSKLSTQAELVGELMGLNPPVLGSLGSELEQISSEMKSHKSTAQSLLRLSDDIRFMVS